MSKTKRIILRNVIAILTGIFVSFSLVAIWGYVIMRLRIYPFYDFLYAMMSGNKKDFFELGRKVSNIIFFGVFPIISVLVGFVTGMIAKRKRCLIGMISIMPLFLVFYVYASTITTELLYAFILLMASVTLGALLSKILVKNNV